MSIRDGAIFVPHVQRDWNDLELLNTGVTNLIHKSKNPDEQWIVALTERIGDWRSKSRSTYVRWALTINGMHLAESTYKDWPEDKAFQVKSIRPRSSGPEFAVLAQWDGAKTADNYKDACELISAYGVCDLYGCLEEIIFDAYRTFLEFHPTKILGGSEYKELRKLYNKSKSDPAHRGEWESRWRERLDQWQRKRAYDRLGAVLLAFTAHAKIKKPHWYKNSSPVTWAETLSGIGELRNLVTHGVATVSSALGDFSRKPHNAGFDFEEGKPLKVRLHHLMGVECFIDQLLTALNASLIERAMGPQPPLKLLLR